MFYASVIFDCSMSEHSDPESVNNPMVSNISTPLLEGGDGNENTAITETVAAVEIPPSTSVPTLPPAAILQPPVVPSLVHEVSMPELTVSSGGNKLDDPHPNTTEH